MFNLQLPDYSNLTIGLVAIYALAGLFGALVRVAWLDKPLRGFYRDDDGGLHMGFMAEVVIGVAVAISIDGHPVRAGIAAVFAPFILDMGKAFIMSQGTRYFGNNSKGSNGGKVDGSNNSDSN